MKIDVESQRRIAEQNQILSRELSHRIKNIFAVVNGLIGLSARQFPGMKDFARQMQGAKQVSCSGFGQAMIERM